MASASRMWGGDDVEIVVKRACFAGFEAGHASVTSADFHHCGIKAFHFVAQVFGGFDERVDHCKRVAVASRAAGYYSNFHFFIVFEFWL